MVIIVLNGNIGTASILFKWCQGAVLVNPQYWRQENLPPTSLNRWLAHIEPGLATKFLVRKRAGKSAFPAASGNPKICTGAALTNAALIPKLYSQASSQQAVCVHRICVIILLQ
ncbi:hypothetical protein [Collimonas humicola]|uniref:hypothetical protein n=1 Tax=Collimonas humicola TaxID=2825886 RepID=UPI001B8CCD1F|nr:hypothetical protein [Collimonas humicola]